MEYEITMKQNQQYKVKDWVIDLQRRGRITFSRQEVEEQFSSMTESAIVSALRRLVQKGEIVSVWKGFYANVPIKYASRGIVPPELYIDHLMKFLNRSYYVALLNAAAFYGAAHQQPQVFSVMTNPPALRDTNKRGTRIAFVIKKEISVGLLKSIKTETGYIQVSSPELTAADLITYQKEIGGLNRASTVLNELAESLDFKGLNNDFLETVPISTIQRLGFLLEQCLDQNELADNLYIKAKEAECTFQKIPLKSGKKSKDCEVNEKWKIIINEQIEIDE